MDGRDVGGVQRKEVGIESDGEKSALLTSSGQTRT